LLILSQSELIKEKRQQAGAKEKSLLTAERKNERERERERERETEREREIVIEKAGWKGAPNHTL
jgi:hypothetical protein